MMQAKQGRLWVVATPIGNLQDITLRALEILKSVDLIACEDTRTSAKLLQHHGITAKTFAYHEHNESQLAPRIADQIEGGSVIALISDAGTPAISDPGFRLVRECRRRSLEVSPIPGACAITSAIAASGLPTHQFFFAGFLPPKSAKRKRFFQNQLHAEFSAVCYESTHRIEKFVAEALEIFGPERVIAVCRELTKAFETFTVGRLAEVVPKITGKNTKGEIVIVIAPEGYEL